MPRLGLESATKTTCFFTICPKCGAESGAVGDDPALAAFLATLSDAQRAAFRALLAATPTAAS
jgi:hypothetical protein